MRVERLGRFNILIGPNNSGKTYLAWAAYSLSRLNTDAVKVPASVSMLAEKLLNSKTQGVAASELLATRNEVLRNAGEALRGQLPMDFAAPRDKFDATRLEITVSDPNVESSFLGSYLFSYRSKLGVTVTS